MNELEKVPEVVETIEKAKFEYRLQSQLEHDGWIDYTYEKWLIPTNMPIDASKDNGFIPILIGYNRFQITVASKDLHVAKLKLMLEQYNIYEK